MLSWLSTLYDAKSAKRSASPSGIAGSASYCPNCFQSPDSAPICQNCGFDTSNIIDEVNALPIFTGLSGGRYRVGRILKPSIGNSIIYAGMQTFLSRPIAITEFFPCTPNKLAQRASRGLNVITDRNNFDTFTIQLQQFLEKARLLATLRNPHIVAVHDLLEENNTAYLITERLNGISLEQHMGGMRHTAANLVFGQRLSLDELTILMLALIDALCSLHERSAGPVLHLNIRPDNILIPKRCLEQLVILGFSSAVECTNSSSYRNNALIADAMNLAFMSPEQADFKSGDTLKPAADCYSIGACLYAAAIGLAPPTASLRRAGAPLVDLTSQLPTIDPNIAVIIASCLNLDPASRPQSARELHQRLAKLNFSIQSLQQFSYAPISNSVSTSLITSPGLIRVNLHPNDVPKYIARQRRTRYKRWRRGVFLVIVLGAAIAWWYSDATWYSWEWSNHLPLIRLP